MNCLCVLGVSGQGSELSSVLGVSGQGSELSMCVRCIKLGK